ncbi:MFS transporter [Pontibacillus sp. HMF3514]|uniref:MFS transporter n=1 Tax=Pontibacillus sp. HMF3514 TaxID=2692425 RepID=UPI00131F5FF2|nr:MFS transporter [Pontibacillus sp. HMF3514]QHE52684.1 MFS transporter [Pontibacillus sp. HMF3514]
MNNKVLYSLMMLFSSMSGSMYMIVVGWLLYELSGNAFYSGMLIGIGFLPGLILNLIFGVIVDRLNRKRIALIGLSITTAVFLIFAITAELDMLHVWLLFMFHLILRSVHSMNRPALQALVVGLFSKKDYAKVIGISTSLSEFGMVTGASLAGVLLAILPDAEIILIIVMLSSLAIISLSIIKVENVNIKDTPVPQPFLTDLKNGYSYLKNNNIVLYLIIIGFVGQLTVHSNTGLLPVYTNSYLETSSKVFGLLEGTFSISAIIAGIFASWMLKKYKSFATVYSLLLIMVGLSIFSFTRDVTSAFIGIFFIGLGTTLLRVSTQSLQQMITEPNYHGRMASFRMLINQGSVVVGSPILGLISEYFGANRGYLAMMIPVVIILLFAVVTINKTVTHKRIANVLQP